MSSPRHTKEDALSEREFELLLEGASRLDEPQRLQARFLVLVCGRLGLRAGELAHMRAEWVDWRRRFIQIPRHEPCEKGKWGDECGYCRGQAQQMVEYHDDVSMDEALARMWNAKTDAAARSVPFDFDARTELVIERFFDEHDAWPVSRGVVNRRVKSAADAADDLDPEHIYPHALRGTAASYHAGRGLDVLPLQSMFGWSCLSTARCYVKSSPENTARALHQIHSR